MNTRTFRLFVAVLGGTVLALLLVLSFSSSPAARQPSVKPRALPPPQGIGTCGQGSYTLCLSIYTGSLRSTFIISNPGGVSGFNEYHLVNFDQRLLSQSPTSLEIEVSARRYVDTHAPYPVNTDALPDDVQGYLLPQAGWIQSDDPLIVAKAQELVDGAIRQVEAVDAIQAWVRGNITYGGSPNDASSVFRNRSGVCAGFSTLTVALLRAAGIPARYHSGCVASAFPNN